MCRWQLHPMMINTCVWQPCNKVGSTVAQAYSLTAHFVAVLHQDQDTEPSWLGYNTQTVLIAAIC